MRSLIFLRKNCVLLFCVGLIYVMGIGAGAFARPPETATTRPSADGGILPDVTAPAVVKLNLPLVGDKLGCTPEELNAKIYTIKSASDVLPKGMEQPATEWCGGPAFGAEGIGYGMTDGRVTRIVLYWLQPNNEGVAKFVEAMKGKNIQVGKKDDKPTLIEVQDAATQKPVRLLVAVTPTKVSVEVEPAQWYVLVHKPSEEIAKAMFAHKLLNGMSFDEAVAALGQPEKQDTYNPQGTRVWWYYEGTDPATGKLDMRELSAVVKDGVLTQCGEEKRTPVPN